MWTVNFNSNLIESRYKLVTDWILCEWRIEKCFCIMHRLFSETVNIYNCHSESFRWHGDSRFVEWKNHELLQKSLHSTRCVKLAVCITVAQYGSTWHTTTGTIVSSYSAFSRQKMNAEIGGFIGLMHINITFKGEGFIYLRRDFSVVQFLEFY